MKLAILFTLLGINSSLVFAHSEDAIPAQDEGSFAILSEQASDKALFSTILDMGKSLVDQVSQGVKKAAIAVGLASDPAAKAAAAGRVARSAEDASEAIKTIAKSDESIKAVSLSLQNTATRVKTITEDMKSISDRASSANTLHWVKPSAQLNQAVEEAQRLAKLAAEAEASAKQAAVAASEAIQQAKKTGTAQNVAGLANQVRQIEITASVKASTAEKYATFAEEAKKKAVALLEAQELAEKEQGLAIKAMKETQAAAQKAKAEAAAVAQRAKEAAKNEAILGEAKAMAQARQAVREAAALKLLPPGVTPDKIKAILQSPNPTAINPKVTSWADRNLLWDEVYKLFKPGEKVENIAAAEKTEIQKIATDLGIELKVPYKEPYDPSSWEVDYSN